MSLIAKAWRLPGVDPVYARLWADRFIQEACFNVAIQPLAVGRAARAINRLARYPRTGEGARSTHQARI